MENEVDTINLPRKEDLLAWLAWLVAVIFLLLWDVGKAWKRRAPWIPEQALVLSAFITEFLFFIDCSHISVDSGSRYQTEEVEAILVKNQLVIDSARLMMCVLIAYLLPGMARSGSITGGSNLAALALSITFHVFSEFRSHWKVEKRNESLSALAASSFAIILNLVIIYLLLLLIHAFVIGRPIRKFISQNVPSAISCCTTSCGGPKCKDIEDHVLKCWIVVRLCQPDYVLSRSRLCSTLWPTVTICFVFYILNIIINILDWIFIDNDPLNSVTKGTLVQLVITGQIVIVVIGWIVLRVRWVTSDRQGNISGQHYFEGILQDLKSELKAHFIGLIGLFVRDRGIHERRIRDMNNTVRELFWYPRNKTTRASASVSNEEVRDYQFSKYKETLNMLLVPGESAWKLWKANLWGFNRVERYMEQGKKDSERSPSELICLLKTRTPEDEADRETARTAVSLIQANKKSWKRTAVSLIHFMIYFYDGSDASASVIEDAMQCYIQGREYMDIVDGLNEEVKSLGRQADGEFYSLQDSWNERAQPKIKQLLRQLRDQLQPLSDVGRRNLQNSLDSTEVAKYCLFETGRVIDPETWRVINPEINQIDREIIQIDRLQRVLAKVYFFYMKEDLKEAVLQKCHKLAEEGMEEEILDVAFLAAKAQAVLEKVREGHNTDQASTSSHILTGSEQVLEGHDTDQSSDWSSIHTEDEEVVEGNDPKDPVELPHNTDQESISSPIQTEIEPVGTGEGIRLRRRKEIPPFSKDEFPVADISVECISEGEFNRRLYHGPEFHGQDKNVKRKGKKKGQKKGQKSH